MLNWKWDLEIQHNPQELGEPYEIYFFLGAIPSSPSDWRYSNTLLFEPIASRAHNTIKEFRFLNSHLEHHYGKEVKDDDVIPHLHKDLSWRVKRVRTVVRLVTGRISSKYSVMAIRKRSTTRSSSC